MITYLDDADICRKGNTLVTELIQKRIDEIAASGGGKLIIPAGRYLCSSLVLPSNFELCFEPGAELIASDNIEDYYHVTTQSMAELSYRALIYAKDATNVTINGGLLIGQGEKWFAKEADAAGYRMPESERPRMLVMEDCDQITLRDLKIYHSPMWTIHLACCRDINIDNVKIENDLHLANTDSLDIDSCHHVRISNCYFSAADDGVCIKTTKKNFGRWMNTQNVTVTNCVIRSRGGAIKVGTETFGNVENIVANNITVFDSNRAVALVSRDGGHLRHMIFSNITFESRLCAANHWGRAEPVGISLRYRNPDITPGNIENIIFQNLTGTSQGAISLYSEVDNAISGISFNKVSLKQQLSQNPGFGTYDVRPPCNPDNPTGMGIDNSYKFNPETGHPFGVNIYEGGISGFYIYNVRDVAITDFHLEKEDPDNTCWNKEEIVTV
ncbi:MAG: glycoside hydrolase family 28 protein [Vibrio sp.]